MYAGMGKVDGQNKSYGVTVTSTEYRQRKKLVRNINHGGDSA
jgi:hypothetical protein